MCPTGWLLMDDPTPKVIPSVNLVESPSSQPEAEADEQVKPTSSCAA